MILFSATNCRREPDPELRIVLRAPIRSLDPYQVHDPAGRSVASNLFDALVAIAPDGKIEPALAVSWTNPNESTWVFELRKSVRFHDGSLLTPDDVKFALDHGAGDSNSWASTRISSLRQVKVVDKSRVEIATDGPAPLLLNQLAQLMIPRGGGDPVRAPVGTGPYRLKSFTLDREVVLERFPEHWRGKPRWAGAQFRSQVPGQPSGAEQILSREVDLTEAPGLEETARLLSSGSVQVFRRPAPAILVLGFDVSARPGNPFADLAVRRAIDMALDRAALVRDGLAGAATVADQLAPPGVFGYANDLKGSPADTEGARKALRASGFPGGFRAVLHHSSRDRALALAIARQCEAIGIRFATEELPWNRFGSKLISRTSPAFIHQIAFDNLDASDSLDLALRTRSPDGRHGRLNFSGFSDSSLDEILITAARTLDLGQRYDLLQRAMHRALESRVLLPLCIPWQTIATRRGLVWEGAPFGLIRLENLRMSP